MAVYWITFRLDDDAGYEQRYSKFIDTVRRSCSMWWKDPTSFIAFESRIDIDTLATNCKAALSARDMFLLREMDSKDARIFGSLIDQDIFKLMPYLKKA